MGFDPLLGVGSAPSPRPQILSSSLENFNVQVITTDDKNLSLTVIRPGKVVGFLASVNMRSAGGSDAVLIRVLRNNNLVSSAYIYGPTAPDPGIVFIETLGLLSGADLNSGDIFLLSVQKKEGSTSTFVFDASITLVLQEY